MAGMKLMTGDELMTEAEREMRERPREVMESEYRRGYRDGFIEAVNAMADLFQRRLSKQATYDLLFDHWEGDLLLWTHGACDEKKLPPKVRA